MAARLDDLLAEADLSPAEYAVLTHVADSLVNDRGVLADWTARHVPDAVTAAVTHEECGAAVASLLARGLLVALTADDVARDLERW